MHTLSRWHVITVVVAFVAIVGLDYCQTDTPPPPPCERACRPAVKCGWDHGVVCYPTRTRACVSGVRRTTDP